MKNPLHSGIHPDWLLYLLVVGLLALGWKYGCVGCGNSRVKDELRVVKNKVARLDEDMDKLKEQMKQCRCPKEAK
jgi:DNA anti-recombination protein RmuC